MVQVYEATSVLDTEGVRAYSIQQALLPVAPVFSTELRPTTKVGPQPRFFSIVKKLSSTAITAKEVLICVRVCSPYASSISK